MLKKHFENWSEHFQELLSADRVVQDPALLRIPQLPFKVELDELPSMEELIKAIEQMKSGKAAGVDGIPPEFWKSGGPALHSNNKTLRLIKDLSNDIKFQVVDHIKIASFGLFAILIDESTDIV